MHRGRSDTAANANAISDAPREFASEFWAQNLKLRKINSLAIANGFASEISKISFSLRKFLANGRLRQNSLAIATMAWCTQGWGGGSQFDPRKMLQELPRNAPERI